MAYTIVKSDGTVLTTIADGTINTSSTSLGLPGRNYAGYGQSLDTNFVHVTENFAVSTPPAQSLRGQIWYDTSSTTLKVCPTDGETNALAWLSLTSTASGGNTTFGSVNITGNATANNFTATNDVTANAFYSRIFNNLCKCNYSRCLYYYSKHRYTANNSNYYRFSNDSRYFNWCMDCNR